MTGSNTDPEDTGQISVAELLARNGQKTNLNAGGRRRRGVKGGISVAELTGEIPVVRAEPAADEAPVIAAEPAPAVEPEPEAPQKPVRSTARRQTEPELLSGSTTAAADLLNQAHDESARRPYGSVPSQRPVPATQRPAPDASKPSERSARTSGFVPRSRATRTETPVANDDVSAVEKTTVTPAVQKRPTPIRPMAPSAVAQPSTKAMSKAELADDDEKVSLVKPEADDAVTQVTDAVDAPVSESPVSESPASDAPVSESPAKKDAAKQWLVLAGQGVVAIIVGALLFKGFEKLWDMLPWVALILAVLVIVGLVAVVRILRRTDDMISMVIAIAVGVFVTLGPLAFQLSTG